MKNKLRLQLMSEFKETAENYYVYGILTFNEMRNYRKHFRRLLQPNRHKILLKGNISVITSK